MEQTIIKQRAAKLQTKEDLLNLLNDIVKDELGKEDAFSFSLKQISYFCNPNNARGRYRHFSIPKKSGGKRNIAAPCKGLRHILYYVNIILKAIYKPSEYAMGFVEGRNVVDNATRHLGQNYVFNTDLENFFPSIDQARVWKRFQLKPFNFPQPIANILAGLCCIKEKNENGTVKYILPQGAPTSPLITNAICDTLDRRLNGLARRFGLHFSRYADDITFSSMHYVYKEGGEFRSELKRIIEGQNFRMNEAKTRLQKVGSRQEVTGLTVGTKVNTSHAYVAEIRNILHIWEKYGYTDAFKRFYPKYKESKGNVKKGEPMLENVLYGKLQYLRMVKGSKDPVYVSLQKRYDKLTSPIDLENDKSLDYLRSFTIAEFEEIIGGPLYYDISKEGNLYGKAILEGQAIIISISSAAKYKLVENKIITDERLTGSIPKTYNPVIANSKPGLYVVLTVRQGKEPFWMMTYYDPTVTDVDVEGISVSNLVDIWEKDGIEAAMDALDSAILQDGMDKSGNQNKSKKVTKRKLSNDSFFSDNSKVVIDEINDGVSPDSIKAIQEEIESGNSSTIVDTIDIWSDDDLDSITDAEIIAEL